MRTLACLVAPVLFAGALAAETDVSYWVETYPTVARIITEAEEDCRGFDPQAELIFEPGAVVTDDLDGDRALAEDGNWDDLVVNFNHIFCSRALTFRHGTGGAPIYFVADGEHVASWVSFGYQVVRFSAGYPAVILIDRHGTACGGFGVSPCVQAIVIEEGEFFTPDLTEPDFD